MAGATATCPAGHVSTDPEYCSVCGTRVGPEGSTEGPAQCPSCEADRDHGAAFCEVCGYDFVTGTRPSPPKVEPAPPPRPPAAAAAATSAAWTAVVSADRAFYDRNGVTEVQFPLGAVERRIPLVAERVTIGRRSASRGIQPTIDLSVPPEDAAVSHAHATLVRQADGSFVLVDNGSTNGTFVAGRSEAVAPNEPVPLPAGTFFNLGAWTQIRIEATQESAP